MIKTKTKITFSRETWEELSSDSYYSEIIEAIEDREELRKAKANTTEFISLRKYDEERKKSRNL